MQPICKLANWLHSAREMSSEAVNSYSHHHQSRRSKWTSCKELGNTRCSKYRDIHHLTGGYYYKWSLPHIHCLCINQFHSFHQLILLITRKIHISVPCHGAGSGLCTTCKYCGGGGSRQPRRSWLHFRLVWRRMKARFLASLGERAKASLNPHL